MKNYTEEESQKITAIMCKSPELRTVLENDILNMLKDEQKKEDILKKLHREIYVNLKKYEIEKINEEPKKLPTNDAWELANEINKQQSKREISSLNSVSVLFNKGRYFEMTVSNKELRETIAKQADVKIEFNNMLVDSKDKLEDLVKAFNDNGIYVKIDVDWI